MTNRSEINEAVLQSFSINLRNRSYLLIDGYEKEKIANTIEKQGGEIRLAFALAPVINYLKIWQIPATNKNHFIIDNCDYFTKKILLKDNKKEVIRVVTRMLKDSVKKIVEKYKVSKYEIADNEGGLGIFVPTKKFYESIREIPYFYRDYVIITVSTPWSIELPYRIDYEHRYHKEENTEVFEIDYELFVKTFFKVIKEHYRRERRNIGER